MRRKFFYLVFVTNKLIRLVAEWLALYEKFYFII
jgi:hypothetical protein